MFDDAKTKRLLLLLIFLPLIGISLWAQKYPAVLGYSRSAIMAGEYWRIVSCHLVHTGWHHLFLNIIGVVLLFVLFAHLYSPWTWLAGILSCMICISLYFLVFCPTLEWYMGLSGVLHGLLLMGLIGEIKKGYTFYYFGLLAIIGKLVMEYFSGPEDLASQFGKAFVISPAHFSGAIIGGVTGCVIIYIHKLLSDQSGGMEKGPAAFNFRAVWRYIL
jgi:rhomboid family GlyGly-CTERM serine protease